MSTETTVQLSGTSADRPVPSDVASAVRAAADELGQRPAVTVLSSHGREEQGFASLAQWTAKGAHLLELELMLSPGDRLRLEAPLSWTSAAVCLAAWWTGVTVQLDGTAEVAVTHESREAPDAADVLWLGDAIDGSPQGQVAGPPWVRQVQTFPDQPPAPHASPDAVALVAGGRRWTQRDLLAMAAALGAGHGTLGWDTAVAGPTEPDPSPSSLDATSSEASPARAPLEVVGLAAVTLRPLVAGRPTVVLRDLDRTAADGEKVRVWLPDGVA